MAREDLQAKVIAFLYQQGAGVGKTIGGIAKAIGVSTDELRPILEPVEKDTRGANWSE